MVLILPDNLTEMRVFLYAGSSHIEYCVHRRNFCKQAAVSVFILTLYWYIVVYWRNIIHYTKLAFFANIRSKHGLSAFACRCTV